MFDLNLITFSEIAERYLQEKGLEPLICETEEEARSLAKISNNGKWPCLFTKSNTTGEKDFEEFFTTNEVLDLKRFNNLGVIKNELNFDSKKIDIFEKEIETMKASKRWNKLQIVNLFHKMIPDFGHKETGKYLDSIM